MPLEGTTTATATAHAFSNGTSAALPQYNNSNNNGNSNNNNNRRPPSLPLFNAFSSSSQYMPLSSSPPTPRSVAPDSGLPRSLPLSTPPLQPQQQQQSQSQRQRPSPPPPPPVVPAGCGGGRSGGRGAKFDVCRGGKKRFSASLFDPADVPYPISYDPHILALDVLDHIFIQEARRNNVTWVDFKDGTPKRSLDIGCGTGGWIMEAAAHWKDCHFVGFDVAPIQPSPAILDQKGISDRVQWVIGNFLTDRLPFEDDSFDHVHLYRISWGVAEDRWDDLFEEVARVLRPGGAVEVGEEDILFPVLSPCYTVKLKSRPVTPPHDASSPPFPNEVRQGLHAHALLESLFFGVFASRKINCRPTSIIPHYLNIHFRHVVSTPYVELPMPPPPVSHQKLRHVASCRTLRRQSSTDDSSSGNSSPPEYTPQQASPPHPYSYSYSSQDQQNLPTSPGETVHQVVTGLFGPVDPLCNVKLLPPNPTKVNDRYLTVHLNSTFRRILACREAMWGELRRRLHLRDIGGVDLLSRFGWDDAVDDCGGISSSSGASSSSQSGHGGGGGCPAAALNAMMARQLENARARFEEMIARFEEDMLRRIALADAIETNLGWKRPSPEPLSKYERMRQRELDNAVAEAVMAEPEGLDQAQITRSFKGFIGFKDVRRR